MSGDVSGPVTLDEVDPTDSRHEYTIEGMACPDCITQVAGKVLQVRGATRVEVDYDEKRLIVFSHEEHGSKLETLPMHLELAGFRVTPVSAPRND